MNNKPVFVITFLGVDGAGKTSTINKLRVLLKNKYGEIIIHHLKPNLLNLKKNTSIFNPQIDPHSKPLRSSLVSLLKIFYWLIIYKIFFFLLLKKHSCLVIFDRYVDDILIDHKRYRYNLSSKITKKILKYFPQPDLWVILTGKITIIHKRKNELPILELKRQSKKYINFYKSKKNALLLNTSKSIKFNVDRIIKEIIK